MSKATIYLPDELAGRLKQHPRINLSKLVQEALEQRLDAARTTPRPVSEEQIRDLLVDVLQSVVATDAYNVDYCKITPLGQARVEPIRCRGYPDRPCPQFEVALENGQHFVLMVFEA